MSAKQMEIEYHPGFTKIHTLSNLGIFENFAWPRPFPELTFKRITLLHGYNGCGKTTLANVLSLFSEEISEEEKEALQNDLKSDPQRSVSVHIDWDGKSVKSLSWKRKKFLFLIQHLLKTTSITATSQKLNYLSSELLHKSNYRTPISKNSPDKLRIKTYSLTKSLKKKKFSQIYLNQFGITCHQTGIDQYKVIVCPQV